MCFIVRQEELALLVQRPSTISILIIDSSGSMMPLREAVITAVDNHITAIKEITSADQYCCVVSFSSQSVVQIPLTYAYNIGKMDNYNPGGNTLLYETVDKALENLIGAYDAIQIAMRKNLKIIVSVFSDGDDNESDKNRYPAYLKIISQKALTLGIELLAFGIGIDGQQLAINLGFEKGDSTDAGTHSATFAPTAVGIAEATSTLRSITQDFSSRR